MCEKYQVIYADPPWDYTAKQVKGATPYPTVTANDLINGDIGDFVRSLHDPNTGSVLLMWCTYPKIADGLAVMHGWGYDYKTTWCTWIKLTKDQKKVKTGLGWWARGNGEFIMLGTKNAKGGRPTVRQQLKDPTMNNMNSVLFASAGRHSAKPDEIYERIDTFFQPHTKKIELFARPPLYQGNNWHYWGNEVPGYPKVFSVFSTESKECKDVREEEGTQGEGPMALSSV